MKFKVGDKVKIVSNTINPDIDAMSTLVNTIGTISYCYPAGGGVGKHTYDLKENSWCWNERDLKLVTGKRGRPAKPIKKAKEHTWVIFKDSCNNHEETFTCSEESALQNLKQFGVGYSLHKLGRAYAKYELSLKLSNPKRETKKVKKK